MKKVSVIIIALFYLFPAFLYPATQRQVEYTGKSIEIKTTTGAVTSITFPIDIQNIVSGFDKKAISLETSGSHLFIQPIYAPSGNLFVITEDNFTFPLTIVNVSKEQADVSVTIRPTIRGGILEGKAKGEKGLSIVDLIKGLITGRVDRSAKISNTKKRIYKDKTIELVLYKTYVWTHYIGYRCKLQNISGNSIVVPIQRIYIPKLRAISTDKDVLKPQEKTFVYLLIEK